MHKGCRPVLICLSETHERKNLPVFIAYDRFYLTREIKEYVGVCMYVKSGFLLEQIKDNKYIFDLRYF